MLLTKVTDDPRPAADGVQLNIDFVDRKIEFGGPIGQWWTQMSLAIIAGLIFATILTLVRDALRVDGAGQLARLAQQAQDSQPQQRWRHVEGFHPPQTARACRRPADRQRCRIES